MERQLLQDFWVEVFITVKQIVGKEGTVKESEDGRTESQRELKE